MACFTEHILKHNEKEYLENVIERANNGEGYIRILGNHVILEKYLTGVWKKDRDRELANRKKGIVSF